MRSRSLVLLLLVSAAGCPGGPPPRQEPPAPPPPELGAGFGPYRLGRLSAVPPEDPALALHPGREALAEWLLSTAPTHRTWWLRGADGGPPAYPHALVIYLRGNNDAPARTRAEAPSWLLRESWNVKRAGPGALVTFLAREATRADPRAALASHGIAARGLLLATPRALVYDSSRPGELLLQLLSPGGDDYALLTFGSDDLGYALREYLLGGRVLVGKLPFPDALPADSVPGHLARSPELLGPGQRATLEPARAALARGPNPAALAELGVEHRLADLRRPSSSDILGRRLGRITDPKPLADHARVRRDEPAWIRRFATAWGVELDVFSGRNDGDLAWLVLLRAGNQVAAPRIPYAHEAILALPHPARFPTASAALEPLGARLGAVQSIHPGFVLARTSREDVFVVGFPRSSSEHGLDGAPAYGLLLLAPGSPVTDLYTGAPGIPWAGLEGEALAAAASRLPRRALIALLRAAPLLPQALGGAEPLLRQLCARQTEALLQQVERSPILAVLAARERVTARAGLPRWDRGYAERIEQLIDQEGRPLDSPALEGLVEPAVARQGEYAKLTRPGIQRLRAYAEERAARGAPATAEMARQLSFGPALPWRTEFLLRHAALPALDDPEFQALVGAMPPLVRTLTFGSTFLQKAIREAPPERLRTGTFEVLPWEVERCELLAGWGEPAARVEVEHGAPDPALVREYEAAVASARRMRAVADASAPSAQVTHHYLWTDGKKAYGHLYTERSIDPVESKRFNELQTSASVAEEMARQARNTMLASQTRSVTHFTPRLHTRFAVELLRRVKLRCGDRLLERELRHATVLAPHMELCPAFEGPDPAARPPAALEAVRARREGERAAILEAARAEADARRALTALKAELFRALVAAAGEDPRLEPRPEGLSELEWAEERAWRAWLLGLPPAEDERVLLDLAKEIQLY